MADLEIKNQTPTKKIIIPQQKHFDIEYKYDDENEACFFKIKFEISQKN